MDQQDIVDELARLADQNARLEAEVTRLREEGIPHVDRSSRRRDRVLSFAYVFVAIFAVGLAGLGSASALDGSNTVFGDDIVAGAVTSGDLKDGGVGAVDVRDGSLSGVEVADGGIAGVDVTDGSIGGVDVTDGSIGSADVGSINGGDVADGTIGTADVANGSIKGEDLNLFSDNQCTGETVLGTAVVNADFNVPREYTTGWLGWQHSCSGQPVQVRKDSDAGEYTVSFGASNPGRLAQVTLTDTPGGFARATNLGPGLFKVVTTAYAPACACLVLTDADFSILVY